PSHDFLVFSFQCSVATRDLHSFPTRRSSDLPDAGSRRAREGGVPQTALRTMNDERSTRGSVFIVHRSSFDHGLCVANTIVTFVPDRKSTRLNSSHLGISYAVFCLKKKKIYNK